MPSVEMEMASIMADGKQKTNVGMSARFLFKNTFQVGNFNCCLEDLDFSQLPRC